MQSPADWRSVAKPEAGVQVIEWGQLEFATDATPLGAGSFGTVLKAWWKTGLRDVAVKKMPKAVPLYLFSPQTFG